MNVLFSLVEVEQLRARHVEYPEPVKRLLCLNGVEAFCGRVCTEIAKAVCTKADGDVSRFSTMHAGTQRHTLRVLVLLLNPVLARPTIMRAIEIPAAFEGEIGLEVQLSAIELDVRLRSSNRWTGESVRGDRERALSRQ